MSIIMEHYIIVDIIALFMLILGIKWIFLLNKKKKKSPDLRWNWDTINLQDPLEFPDFFEFGVATSEYQISGCEVRQNEKSKKIDSNWSRFESKKNWLGKCVIEPASNGIDHWNRFLSDISLIKELGVSVYRCSIAWERVQPRENYYDQAVIAHYHQLFDECKSQNIKLMVTLHHFVNPGWFEDKGGFEKEENIAYFVEFAKKMFSEYHEKVSYWCTINEPGAYAGQTYLTHNFPPPGTGIIKKLYRFFKIPDLHKAGLVTRNLMLTHIATYNAIKTMAGGKNSKIGFAHNIIPFEPYHPNNLIERIITKLLNHVYHDTITQFLKTGTFNFKTLTGTMKMTYPEVHNIQDFIGINYYSHVLCNWLSPTRPRVRPQDKEIPTDMHYGIYAEGLYKIIKDLHALGKPIFITESGIADAYDNRRELWYKRYLYAMKRALNEGVDLRMFCAWSAFDCFEWDLGYTKKFGLYAVNRKTFERRLKPGAEFFKKVISQHNLRR